MFKKLQHDIANRINYFNVHIFYDIIKTYESYIDWEKVEYQQIKTILHDIANQHNIPRDDCCYDLYINILKLSHTNENQEFLLFINRHIL